MQTVNAFAETSWLPGDVVPPQMSSAETRWAAPTPSSAPPSEAAMFSAPPAPGVDPTDPEFVLDELVDTIEGVHAAILASVDGYGLARSESMCADVSHPAAMIAAALGLAHQLVALGGGVELRQLVVDHDGGLLLVWPLGGERVLALLTATNVQRGRVRSFVQENLALLMEDPT
jgi:predicted regulator of Ras-like GTPase activity (Roadblock/LC7/MglB family)